METLFSILFGAVLILVSLVVGHIIETLHFRKLAQQEREFEYMLVTNLKTIPPQAAHAGAVIVVGEAVIATDYFKVFAAGIRNLFGGEMKSLVTLQNRARRQATLRMLEDAKRYGAKAVWNIRYETATIQGQENQKTGGVEIIAYGTALVW